jgi:hypothetical protein
LVAGGDEREGWRGYLWLEKVERLSGQKSLSKRWERWGGGAGGWLALL